MRRGLLILVGLLLAFLAGSLVLVAGTAVLLAGAPLQTSWAMFDAAAWVFAIDRRGEADHMMRVVVGLWWTLVMVCLAPIALAAGLGEVTGRRSRLALSCASGSLAVLGPLAWIAALHPDRVVGLEGSGRVLALLFLSGAASGWTYGLVAGSSPVRTRAR